MRTFVALNIATTHWYSFYANTVIIFLKPFGLFRLSSPPALGEGSRRFFADMQLLPAPIHHARDVAQLPVAIDYPAALALRQMSMVHDELPKYLLAPEVSALLHYVPDRRRKMLLATLWNIGARINEALALTRGDFSLTGTAYTLQHRHAHQRRLGQLWPGGAEG